MLTADWYHTGIKTLLSWKLQAIMGKQFRVSKFQSKLQENEDGIQECWGFGPDELLVSAVTREPKARKSP
jgi:hypothetical protein